jgi:hypothetical protein
MVFLRFPYVRARLNVHLRQALLVGIALAGVSESTAFADPEAYAGVGFSIVRDEDSASGMRLRFGPEFKLDEAGFNSGASLQFEVNSHGSLRGIVFAPRVGYRASLVDVSYEPALMLDPAAATVVRLRRPDGYLPRFHGVGADDVRSALESLYHLRDSFVPDEELARARDIGLLIQLSSETVSATREVNQILLPSGGALILPQASLQIVPARIGPATGPTERSLESSHASSGSAGAAR